MSLVFNFKTYKLLHEENQNLLQLRRTKYGVSNKFPLQKHTFKCTPNKSFCYPIPSCAPHFQLWQITSQKTEKITIKSSTKQIIWKKKLFHDAINFSFLFQRDESFKYWGIYLWTISSHFPPKKKHPTKTMTNIFDFPKNLIKY